MEPSTKQELRTEECVRVIEMGMQSTHLTVAGRGRIDKNLKLLQYLKPLKKATITEPQRGKKSRRDNPPGRSFFSSVEHTYAYWVAYLDLNI